MFKLQELYHEMHALDRFEQDYRHKVQEEDNSNTSQKGSYFHLLTGNIFVILMFILVFF